MVMSWIWVGSILISILCAFLTGQGSSLSGAALEGAQTGITLAISMAGSLCLWAGVGALLNAAGITDILSQRMMPVLTRLFPGTKQDKDLARDISTNICANFLGLGNAATPMGIQAVKQMTNPHTPDLATDEMCRLIVLNTASIQLIPANVAAVRAAFGCPAPFDILPAVWLTSACSAGLGLLSAWILGKLWTHD